VNDGQWFHETNEECKFIAQNDPYLFLPVIGYIDKTGTDASQRTSLNFFVYIEHIMQIWNKCMEGTWFMPDLEHNSSAATICGRSSPPFGKIQRLATSYHRYLAVIWQLFI